MHLTKANIRLIIEKKAGERKVERKLISIGQRRLIVSTLQMKASSLYQRMGPSIQSDFISIKGLAGDLQGPER